MSLQRRCRSQAKPSRAALVASPSQSSVVQLTLHMDHPFWESFAEDSPLHWDSIAAQFVGETAPLVTTESPRRCRPFHPFIDHDGAAAAVAQLLGRGATRRSGNGAMFFGTLSVPIDPGGACTGAAGADYTLDHCPAIRDFFDYVRFTQSTQGHLNSQGSCCRSPLPRAGRRLVSRAVARPCRPRALSSAR